MCVYNVHMLRVWQVSPRGGCGVRGGKAAETYSRQASALTATGLTKSRNQGFGVWKNGENGETEKNGEKCGEMGKNGGEWGIMNKSRWKM